MGLGVLGFREANTCRDRNSAPFAIAQGKEEGAARVFYVAGLKARPSTEFERGAVLQMNRWASPSCVRAGPPKTWFGLGRHGAPLAVRDEPYAVAQGKRPLRLISQARLTPKLPLPGTWRRFMSATR